MRVLCILTSANNLSEIQIHPYRWIIRWVSLRARQISIVCMVVWITIWIIISIHIWFNYLTWHPTYYRLNMQLQILPGTSVPTCSSESLTVFDWLHRRCPKLPVKVVIPESEQMIEATCQVIFFILFIHLLSIWIPCSSIQQQQIFQHGWRQETVIQGT